MPFWLQLIAIQCLSLNFISRVISSWSLSARVRQNRPQLPRGHLFPYYFGLFPRLYAFSPLLLLLPSFSPFPFNTVQSLSRVRFFTTTLTAACQASLSFTVSWNLLKLMSIESVMPSNHLILCHLLLLLPSIFPSIRVFFNELALPIRWPKYWSLSFSISPSNEYSELISFRIDWFDILGVQGTLTSPPASQFESINSSASVNS